MLLALEVGAFDILGVLDCWFIAIARCKETEKGKIKLGHHHNSPQNPKSRFIHNQVVHPQLLT
jgi:hypothetical protein